MLKRTRLQRAASAQQPPAAPVVPPLVAPQVAAQRESRYLRPQDLRRFKDFQFAARLVVEGFYAGRHRSPYYDASAEFADYRPYVPGDELRSLDWRAYARTDRDYIKLFRKETDMRCHILLDTSASMAFRDEERGQRGEERPLSKFEYGAYLTAALSYLMIRQGDKASLGLAGNFLHTYIPPGGTITHLQNALLRLEGAQIGGATQLATALQALFAVARRRGLLIVISDLLEEPTALFSALSMFAHRGWQIVLLHLLTETELNLPGAGGSVRYLDAESPQSLDADPDSLRAAYQAELRSWFETLETQAKAHRILYTRLTTATPYDVALERYLTTRTRA